MISEQLRRAVRDNDVLDSQARRLVHAFDRVDQDRLRQAIDSQDVDLLAQVLGWTLKDLQALVNAVELEADELAHEFSELRELARQRRD